MLDWLNIWLGWSIVQNFRYDIDLGLCIYLNPYIFVNKFLIMLNIALNIVYIKIWLWIMNTIVIDNNMIIATRCL